MSEGFPGFRDPVSAWTHCFGLAASIVGTVVLWRRSRGDRPKQLALLVFGASMIVLYAASTLYHAVPASLDRGLYLKLDASAIYVLIAGTNTPIYYILCQGWRRWTAPLVLWVLSGTGIAAQFLSCRRLPDLVSGLIYLGMGWTGVVAYVWAASVLSHRKVRWLIAGGVLYTVGTSLAYYRWPVLVPGVWGPHEVFHVFVLGGSLMFYLFALVHLVPFRRRESAPIEGNPIPFAGAGKAAGCPAHRRP